MTDKTRQCPNPAGSDSTGAEPSATPPGGIDMGRIVAHLAEQPGHDGILAGHPVPTWDDVRAALAPSGEHVDDQTREANGTSDPPAFQSPQAFYAEAIQRPDIRRILEALDD